MTRSGESPTKSHGRFAGSFLILAMACGTSVEDSGDGIGGTPSSAAEESQGGTAGTSGTAPDSDESGGAGSTDSTTPGCGSANPLPSGTITLDIDGTPRTYVLDVPPDYAPDTPYRLIFVWHALGVSSDGVLTDGYNGLKALADGSAIFVAPAGLEGTSEVDSGDGWWNEGGGDMKFLTAILEQLNANLCIDQERIFSTGFSFGAMMTYALGFQFDVFRAIAPSSGRLETLTQGTLPYEVNNTEPLAIMAFHGDADTNVDTVDGRDALERYRNRNGCQAETQPIEPAPCVAYQGCAAPTVWCEYPGAHRHWSEAPQAIWSFFSQF